MYAYTTHMAQPKLHTHTREHKQMSARHYTYIALMYVERLFGLVCHIRYANDTKDIYYTN